MDEISKVRIRLAHWIEHNVDHIKGYEEAALTLEGHGLPDVAQMVRQGMRTIEAANREFQLALSRLPEGSEAAGHDADTSGFRHCGKHHHSDGHGHGHGHGGCGSHES